MAKPYSLDLRERVVASVEAGASRHEAAERFEVSVSSATSAGVIVCCGSVRDAHNRDYITYIGNKLQPVHKGDDNTSLHSPLPVDETLYMRQPVRQGDDNAIQGFVLGLKKHNLH